MSCLSLRPWQLTIAKDTVAKLTGSWKSVYFSFVFFEFPLVEEYQKCGQIIYGVMMTSRAFPPRGIVHIPDVNAKNQQSDWSNEDKRASRTVLCRRQLEQTTRNPSFSVFTSTRLLEVHLLPSSPISYNLNKMANRKTLTIAQMFNFKSWWCFPGCYPCYYWSVKLPLKYLFLIISECSKIISCLTQDGFDCSQVLPSGLFSRVTERPVKAF